MEHVQLGSCWQAVGTEDTNARTTLGRAGPAERRFCIAVRYGVCNAVLSPMTLVCRGCGLFLEGGHDVFDEELE